MTIDQRAATLYRVERTIAGRLHVSLESRLENRWADIHEHGHPGLLGRGPSPSAVQHYASLRHDREEAARRFAREIADWTRHQAGIGEEEPIRVYASTSEIGAMRSLGDPRLADIQPLDLGPLGPGELAEHPSIREWMSRPLRESR